MDREELMELVRRGPIRITMNDGQSYDVPSVEHCLVSNISISVLVRSREDNQWRQMHLPLVTIASVEELQPQ